MRYVVGFWIGLTALAWPQSVSAQAGEEAPANAGSAIHVQTHLPPQLMLRASYYYVATDPLGAQPSEVKATGKTQRMKLASIPEHLQQRLPGHKHKKPTPEPALKLEGDSAGVEVTPTEQTSQPSKGLSGGAKAGIAVGVILVVGVGVGVGVAAVRSIEVF